MRVGVLRRERERLVERGERARRLAASVEHFAEVRVRERRLRVERGRLAQPLLGLVEVAGALRAERALDARARVVRQQRTQCVVLAPGLVGAPRLGEQRGQLAARVRVRRVGAYARAQLGNALRAPRATACRVEVAAGERHAWVERERAREGGRGARLLAAREQHHAEVVLRSRVGRIGAAREGGECGGRAHRPTPNR